MHTLQSTNYFIEVGSILESSFASVLNTQFKKSKKIILVDENTKKYCLEFLITSFSELAFGEIIEIPSGEENKQLDICIQVWETLTEYKIDRNALLINLGGGLVTDMGGFIASLYKRGISFINIPTTLLAMVDASVGGKTGVDFGVYKNQIGLFSFPTMVFIDPCFISTLNTEEYLNGIAEMIKHGLICDKEHWNQVKSIVTAGVTVSNELILHSIEIKNNIVLRDPFEKNERKKLNFGHTLGHAIESLFLSSNKPIPHGIAVAIGIYMESFISFKLGNLSVEEYNEIVDFIKMIYPKKDITVELIPEIISLAKQDKKNSNGKIKMVLLTSIGNTTIDNQVEEDLISEAIIQYVNY